MKKTMKFLSMAALALVGAVMTGCSSDEDGFTDTPQQPVVTNYSVTKTLRVSLDGGEAGARGITRALTSGGVKTFATGDKLAITYTKAEDGMLTKVETEALKADDISVDGKSATFTVTFTKAPKTGEDRNELTYIYPASIATNDGYIDNSQLNSQDGTLASLASNLDACRKYTKWDGGDLPALTLENAFTIGKFIIKNPSGTAFNNALTSMTISDGTYTYTITPSASAADDPIWVAMRPISAGTPVTVTATDGTYNYSKTITIASGKDLLAGKIYPINVTMIKTQIVDLASLGTDYVAQNGDILINTLGENHKISIAAGATVTLDNASINAAGTWTTGDYAGITCLGDANIILSGANTVKGFYDEYPGIHVPSGSTLTIQGTGSLNASSNGKAAAAGIGGGFNIACGNIEIQGGTINATGGFGAAGIGAGANSTCGSISITNGTVVAHAGDYAAGIGAAFANGNYSTCSGVSISGGSVTAYGGLGAAGIGSALSFTGSESYSQCGDISITGGTVVATGGNSTDIYHPAYQDNFHAYGGAGIGTGATAGDYSYQSNCGNITIGAGVTSVTATKGDEAQNSIGKNHSSTKGTCGTVTIEDGAFVIQN